jgi:hypothetical protein
MPATAVYTKITVPVAITHQQLVQKLKGFIFERKRAIEYYPHATGAREKLNAIEEALYILDNAEMCANTAKAIKMILSAGPLLHFIAPHATRKLHFTWYTKIEQLMNGCREYLGWRKQQ